MKDYKSHHLSYIIYIIFDTYVYLLIIYYIIYAFILGRLYLGRCRLWRK